MDDQDPMTRHMDASRPAIGFPLGTALLLITIFCISGIFSCCYHWDKLRSLSRASSAPSEADTDTVTSPTKPTPPQKNPKLNHSQSLPVIMPGDRIPKFIAWPCPCEPSPAPSPSPSPEKITVVVQTPPPVP